jgi:hypothetical protein
MISVSWFNYLHPGEVFFTEIGWIKKMLSKEEQWMVGWQHINSARDQKPSAIDWQIAINCLATSDKDCVLVPTSHRALPCCFVSADAARVFSHFVIIYATLGTVLRFLLFILTSVRAADCFLHFTKHTKIGLQTLIWTFVMASIKACCCWEETWQASETTIRTSISLSRSIGYALYYGGSKNKSRPDRFSRYSPVIPANVYDSIWHRATKGFLHLL